MELGLLAQILVLGRMAVSGGGSLRPPGSVPVRLLTQLPEPGLRIGRPLLCGLQVALLGQQALLCILQLPVRSPHSVQPMWQRPKMRGCTESRAIGMSML